MCEDWELSYNCFNNNFDIVKNIIENDNIDINIRDNVGYTPLMRACFSNKNDDMIIYLIDEIQKRNADFNIVNYFKETAFDILVKRNGSMRVINKLLDYGATINIDHIIKHNRLDVLQRVIELNPKLIHNRSVNVNCMSDEMKKFTLENLTNYFQTMDKYETDVCPICNDPLFSNKVYTVCGHPFHSDCINTWFEISDSTCPICKFQV